MYFKYPRTPHLPWSDSVTDDDRTLDSIEHFIGKEIVVTIKKDGENSNLYNDYFHARSIDGNHHPSRDWLKNFWSTIKHEIPNGWRICGENLFAKHSIYYENLESYFLMFSIWNEQNFCLSWKDTEEWAELLNIKTVPVIYKGVFDEKQIRSIWQELIDEEGYVLRLAEGFRFNDFDKSIAKFVRKNHVQTSEHWSTEKIIQNKLKNS